MNTLWSLAALPLLLAPAPPPPKPVAFSLLKGWYEARVEGPAVLILRDEDAYARQFDRTFARQRRPRPAAEKVDFRRHQVVAACWGAMPSTGYEVTVVSVTGTAKATTVTVKTTVPRGIADPAITHPAVAVVIPRTARVRVVVTGDRNPPGAWWKDFATTRKAPEVIVE